MTKPKNTLVVPATGTNQNYNGSDDAFENVSIGNYVPDSSWHGFGVTTTAKGNNVAAYGSVKNGVVYLAAVFYFKGQAAPMERLSKVGKDAPKEFNRKVYVLGRRTLSDVAKQIAENETQRAKEQGRDAKVFKFHYAVYFDTTGAGGGEP